MQVSDKDVFPTTMCLKCSSKLDASYDFVQQSHKTQLTLENVYKQIHVSEVKTDNKGNIINDGFTHEVQVFTKDKSTETNKLNAENVEKKNVFLMVSSDLSCFDSNSMEHRNVDVIDKNMSRKNHKTVAASAIPQLSEILQMYTWTCSICENLILKSFQELSKHCKLKHNSVPSLKCNMCNKQYERYRSFTKHLKLHYNTRTYTCELCQKTFTQKTILNSHRNVHSEEKRHVCVTCGKAFKYSSSLLTHQMSHLSDEAKKFACNCCNKKFTTKHTLKMHIKIHAEERNFMCDICGKAFKSKSTLLCHLSTHFEDRSFKCSSCEWSFKSARQLKRHVSLHSTLKAYQCDVCGKQFRERRGLMNHSRIHSGVMPYNCEYCGKSFRFSGTLTIHRRLHTGEKPYSCGSCPRSFTNWANYNKHIKRVHRSSKTNVSPTNSTENSHK